MFTLRLVTNKLARIKLGPFVYAARHFFHQQQDVVPLFHNATKYQDKTAIYDYTGRYTFSNLFVEAKGLANKISGQLNGRTGERVLFLCPNDASYVITLWAIWMSGQIAVPLSPMHPESLLQYYVNDTNSPLLVSSAQFKENMVDLAKASLIRLHVLDENILAEAKRKISTGENALQNILPTEFYQNREAMILYTSGTTGNPKGVVLTHKNIHVQVKILNEAWKWSENDVILHTLPLHHVHGIVNALFCPLFKGATTIMMPKFNAADVWSYLLNRNGDVKEKVTVFMAVPTIYSKLIEEHNKSFQAGASAQVRTHLSTNVRLMVSGSAPLPTPLYEKWLDISGHKLLERYGMTEILMCLSNLYDSDREPGFVGLPLPSVSIALADQDTGDILFKCRNDNGKIIIEVPSETDEDITGELLVKGDSVFKEYHNKPKETEKEFTEDGWFKTGDISQYVRAKNKIRMLGRKSADIIKSGGYKISALQIETLLLAHPGVKECAVLGVTDEVYGERIGLVVVPCDGFQLDLDDIKLWASGKMPKYWVPTVLKVVDNIPKNAMGKINKKELNKALFM